VDDFFDQSEMIQIERYKKGIYTLCVGINSLIVTAKVG